MIENSNDETNFSHKLLLTATQVLRIREHFANGSSANIEFSKTQLSEMIQSGRFNIIDLMNPLRVMSKIVHKAEDLCNKVSLNDIIKATVTSRKIILDLKNFLEQEQEL